MEIQFYIVRSISQAKWWWKFSIITLSAILACSLPYSTETFHPTKWDRSPLVLIFQAKPELEKHQNPSHISTNLGVESYVSFGDTNWMGPILWDASPLHGTMHAHLHVGAFKSSQYTYWNVLKMWEETKEPRRNPHGDRDQIETVTQA